MPRTHKKSAAVSRTPDQHRALNYIQDTLAALEGDFDREAVFLLCGPGIFCAEDPAKLNEAVERLYDAEPIREKVAAAVDALYETDLTEVQRDLVGKISDLPMEELLEATDTAYLLGIAVGRRLGPLALRPAPRQRKAVA
ncbi:MAG: hypothetical protein M3P18_03485 [Actinomycetota bacterium]|nr:hypothetical protein [Actinomycetota bacterium]